MTVLRNRRTVKGAELLEFTLALLPLLMMMFVLLDVAWGMYVKSTLLYAVRAGVRKGITITGTQATGSDLTSMVKDAVQANALGLLAGPAGRLKIQVHYLQPPDPGSSAMPVDVSASAAGNAPGNIMQVSIQGFSLGPLVPRVFGWKTLDFTSTNIGAVAADLIEPSRDVPSIGSAP
jgi:Flp pilus assembly protein TadG